MRNECIIELLCSPVHNSTEKIDKAMHNSSIIDLFCLTEPFCTKIEVNQMYINESKLQFQCSHVQESPKNEVKAMYN